MNFEDISLDYDVSSVPVRIRFVQGSVMNFGDDSFKLEHELSIPIIDSTGTAKFTPMRFDNENGNILKKWLLDRKGILLWDYSKSVGSELGIYGRI
jgi:hypothetical protein